MISNTSLTQWKLAFLTVFLFFILNFFSSALISHYLPSANLETNSFNTSPNFVGEKLNLNLRDLWLKWDSHFYLSIAVDGYSQEDFTADVYKNWAFYPLYPLSVKIISSLLFIKGFVGTFYVGIILSTIFIVTALFYLQKILDHLNIDKTEQIFVLFLLLAFPGSYVFNMFYSESLFILTMALFFYHLFRKNYFSSAVFLSLALITRAVGIALVPAFIVYFVLQERKGKELKDWFLELVMYGFIIGFPLFIFYFYLFILTGNFLAAFDIQTVWGNAGFVPFGIFFKYLDLHGFSIFWDYFLNVVAVLIFLIYLVWAGFEYITQENKHKRSIEVYSIFSFLAAYGFIMSTVQNFNSIFRYIGASVFIFVLPFLLNNKPLQSRGLALLLSVIVIISFLHLLTLAFFVLNVPIYGF